MTTVVIHSTRAEARVEMAHAILRHFGFAHRTVPYDNPKVTIHLPGVNDDDAEYACRLYLEPHALLHFIHGKADT